MHHFYNAICSCAGLAAMPTSFFVPWRLCTHTGVTVSYPHSLGEHFNELLNQINPFDTSFVDKLPTLTRMHSIPVSPKCVKHIVEASKRQGLRFRQSAGESYWNMGVNVSHAVFTGLSLRLGSPRPCISSGNSPTSTQSIKGDKSACGNYCTVISGKIVARILLARRQDVITDVILPESQSCFRRNRSTIDMIFAARRLQGKCREKFNISLWFSLILSQLLIPPTEVFCG